MPVTATGAPPEPQPPAPYPARSRRRGRRALAALATLLAIALLAAGSIAVINVATKIDHPPGCTVADGDGPVTIDLDQAANATTIAAVAKQERLPDHAVTVALAAALQESRLRNLAYGDRDSLGLFQQRPSQGWGTPVELTTPRYAAAAFYRELQRVDGWQNLPVNDAAQRVQRSGVPDAYAQWEPEARALAVALTGQQAAAFTCRFKTSKTAHAADYMPALTRELGPIDLAAPSSATAWTAAAWLIGHARTYGITSVEMHGRRWTASSGRWNASDDGGAAERSIQVRQVG